MMKSLWAATCLLITPQLSAEFAVERVFLPPLYSRGDANVRVRQPIDEAAWIWLDGVGQGERSFLRFRRDFAAPAGGEIRFDVSADERFILFLDGREIARGPHRGLVNRWNYQSYLVTNLAEGSHRLEAVAWTIGVHAPLAQISYRGGFVLKGYGEADAILTTGKAEWLVGKLEGTRMTKRASNAMFGVGSACEVRGESILTEEPQQWADAKIVMRQVTNSACGLMRQGWILTPTMLADMMYEVKRPGRIVRGTDLLAGGVCIAAKTRVEALWDLENYYCAYPLIKLRGGKGAKVTWMWSEALRDAQGAKGNRAAYEGRDLTDNAGDVFIGDGRAEASFTTPWWRCGRWCKLVVETADEPVEIVSVELAETRYPVKDESVFVCDNEEIRALQPICERVFQMCCHEMFFDCPYYEQQMYPGDSRVEYLVSGLFDTEDRVVRQAISLYDADRRENGMIAFNAPTRGTQEGFGYVCCEVMMLGDYAWQHNDFAFLRARAPGMNHTLMGAEEFARADGLVARTPGWSFVDWVPRWRAGVPPQADSGAPNAEINLQYLHAILAAVRVEEALGEELLAAHWRARAERLKAAIKKEFWCEEKALFATNAERKDFSEHAQCLALLADVITGEEAKRCFEALITNQQLDRTTIYFKHYLFETYFKFGRADLFFENLDFWHDCVKWGLSTVLEMPDITSRSDCHAWGSHPLWHLQTGVAGVQSAAAGFRRVLVKPQPGPLNKFTSSTPTPHGKVEMELDFSSGVPRGKIRLPQGLEGDFEWKNEKRPLKSGVNLI